MEPINVGLIGAGTIGCGVYKIIHENNDIIENRSGIKLILKRIADIDIERKRPVEIPKELFTKDAYEIINDESISIVVELVGGTTIAREFVLAAIRNGKSVVTANKALIAHYGDEIFSEAQKNNVEVAFEASVGGGIPIIKATQESYVANNIKSIHGIINGTSNYILHKMTEDGSDFNEVLKQAQDEGYAEADPSFDVDGVDAAHKLSILILLSYGVFLKFEDIPVEGIRNITQTDIHFADQLGYKIKLLAIVKSFKQGLQAGVYPCLVRKQTQLADVKDAFNAIYVVGDAVGPSMLYGMGAGMMPTASAVVSDIVSISKNLSGKSRDSLPKFYSKENEISLLDIKKSVNKYYLRFQVEDQPGTLGEITSILGNNNISIESVIQKGREDNGGEVPVIMMTHEVIEENLLNAIKEIKNSKLQKSNTIFIRIEDL
ncbi:MAG: homoserine dehydrogenase [Candidatus Dadabacteria bacterium]|nr:homoserine dehydrogenase [Candidatus Dadabacteria bacterium]NIQ14475.1 homoserine dehydrogenase [Candidatus Dadabacteria bacterium]